MRAFLNRAAIRRAVHDRGHTISPEVLARFDALVAATVEILCDVSKTVSISHTAATYAGLPEHDDPSLSKHFATYPRPAGVRGDIVRPAVVGDHGIGTGVVGAASALVDTSVGTAADAISGHPMGSEHL